MKLTMTDTPAAEDVAEIMAGLKAFNRNFGSCRRFSGNG